jgi:hypothetical protein
MGRREYHKIDTVNHLLYSATTRRWPICAGKKHYFVGWHFLKIVKIAYIFSLDFKKASSK